MAAHLLPRRRRVRADQADPLGQFPGVDVDDSLDELGDRVQSGAGAGAGDGRAADGDQVRRVFPRL
ncbi:hypothetical protein ABZ791_35680 [Streptomyces huasconensis]|uniref:Uncharacterized protein n=1 Tax=Streptomyces huasconensis TaxID=1854574 RepID=A0ABV3M2P7_9ACTN